MLSAFRFIEIKHSKFLGSTIGTCPLMGDRRAVNVRTYITQGRGIAKGNPRQRWLLFKRRQSENFRTALVGGGWGRREGGHIKTSRQITPRTQTNGESAVQRGEKFFYETFLFAKKFEIRCLRSIADGVSVCYDAVNVKTVLIQLIGCDKSLI